MAKSSTSIPKYKRSRTRARGGSSSFFGWTIRIILGVILFTVLWVVVYRFIPPPITATMISDMAAGRGATRDWMSLDDMDRDMVRAAIGAEDSKFCTHNGFDQEAIEDAMERNAQGGRIRGGFALLFLERFYKFHGFGLVAAGHGVLDGADIRHLRQAREFIRRVRLLAHFHHAPRHVLGQV